MKKVSNLTLSAITALWLSWCVSKDLTVNSFTNNVSSKTKTIIDNSNKLNDNISESNNNSINKTISLIWENEFKCFINLFNITNKKDYSNKVNGIQKKFLLKVDWVIWANTLKVIYLNYYSKLDKNKLPFDVYERLKIYDDMEWYKNHPWKPSRHWTLMPTNVPNIFSNNYYKWIWNWENIKWTFINKELSRYISDKLNMTWNIAVLYETKWKFFVAVYVEWNLELLSYTSPWSEDIKWWIKTTKWRFVSKWSDKYHISWATNSIIRTSSWLKWAIMPYAVHINKWIFVHAWYTTWERRSHWCIRLPIFYAKWLYDIFIKSGNINWSIEKS